MGEWADLEQISVMNYSKLSDARFKLKISTGKFYRVKADIASFFPSIYNIQFRGQWMVVIMQR